MSVFMSEDWSWSNLVSSKIHQKQSLVIIRSPEVFDHVYDVRCRDIAAELNEMFAQAGLLEYRSFGYGHSFGVLSHYYGREAGLELREDIDTVIKVGRKYLNTGSWPDLIQAWNGDLHGANDNYSRRSTWCWRIQVTVNCWNIFQKYFLREHDIIVVNTDGSTENITKFPFGPQHNIIV